MNINCHRCGPPPNWKDYKTRCGFRWKKYVKDFEAYTKREHEHMLELIDELDDFRALIGEQGITLSKKLDRAIVSLEEIETEIIKNRDRWSLLHEQYKDKYNEDPYP